jgi:trehalose 6-phosphate synthase/phosphatase
MIPGSGGLVSALGDVKSDMESVWVGTAPGVTEKDKVKFPPGLLPIFVSPDLYRKYYDGFSNDVLWPLFHYESQFVKFQWESKYVWEDWESYKKVNQIFAASIAKIADNDDLIWVHDFHLFLLPKYLKEKKKKLKVGFFLHIPFPTSEIFRQLPVRRELLEGLIESDLIGFHDYSYLSHFCKTIYFILGLESSLLSVQYKDHNVQLGVFPVSIDTKKFQRKSKSASVLNRVKQLKKANAYEKLILGVDRLDYIKGIDLKLKAFREALFQNPNWVNKVTLLQIAIPSRLNVPEYVRLKMEIDRLVGQINGEFGNSHYVPVLYIFSSVSFTELTALYRVANVLFITSKRDGMNLVSLEYLAAQPEEDPGIVLLSEFAGAVSNLSHVFAINPWDIRKTAKVLAHALNMPKDVRAAMHKPMIKYLEKYTASEWARSFLKELKRSYEPEFQRTQIISKHKNLLRLPESLTTQLVGKKIRILLDYDGTLVPICPTPEEATLPPNTKKQLQKLIQKEKLEIVIVSARDSHFIQKQLKGLDISIACEHGAKFIDWKTKKIISLVSSDRNSWYPIARKIMNDYAYRVPGSFVEKKDYALSWHFRKSPKEFSFYQSRKLREELEMGLANLPVTILSGKKVIEARTIEANKGTFARWYIDRFWEKTPVNKIILAMGDDQTDEEMFEIIEKEGLCVKVGAGGTRANYRVSSQEEVLPFLKNLSIMK